MSSIAERNSTDLASFAPVQLEVNPGHAWLNDLRRSALERFRGVGFPAPGNREWEQWRFTQLRPITETKFTPAIFDERVSLEGYGFGAKALVELVFVNGHFAPKLSRLGKLPRGVTVGSLADALAADGAALAPHLGRHAKVERNPFVALNTSHVRDGAVITIPSNVTIEGAIHLLFVSTASAAPTSSHPRVLVVAGDNVEAQIVESYVGRQGVYFTNAVTEIVLGSDCRIDHVKLQQESLDAYHVATMQVKLGRATQFVSHSITTGGRITRNDLNCEMAGERAYATLNGLVLIGGVQHCDNHTLLDHAEPNCPSHELYKHVLAGKASGVFKGQILVRKDAQKTDSKQNSRTLLLSDDAYMNSMPALEIYADDVKCTHGSTTGPVDEEQVFYLQSRGLSLDAARHLMTYAFAADVTRRIKCEPVRERIEDFMAAQHGLPRDLRINDLASFDDDLL
jgi:Fe-S cluster assembly protein SufD